MKKIYNKAYILISCILIVALSVLTVITPDKLFSEKENRRLTQKPELTSKTLFAGDYTTDLGKYFADQFPFRDIFVCTKAYFELALGKGQNNGVILAENNALIPTPKKINNRLYDNLSCIKDLAERTNIMVTVAALPRTIDVFSEYLPKTYPKENINYIWNDFNNYINKQNISSVDLYSCLCENNFYYKTDHHYTTEGAYWAYTALGDYLDYQPMKRDYFNIEAAAKDFCGTSMRTSGFYLTGKDTIELYRYKNDTDYSIIADGEKIPLYDFSKLKTTDKYAVFLGGNHSRVDITSEQQEREKILLIRDSFADSIAPFLAIHYNLVLIDLRYYQKSVAELIKQEKIDKLLVFESIGELAEAKNFSYLKID